MAVQTEKYEASEVDLSGVFATIFDSLYRRKDGRWMFRLKVDEEATLPDGRRIRLARHIAIPATEQIGRRAFRMPA
jgi:hypothetical protein